jgi:iron complex transport system ATP-binding protein
MILDLHDLAFAYDGRPVLADVRLAVPAGEIVAVLGPNGVGKTTLLKCINAILRADKGVILVDAEDVRRMAPSQVAARIGYVAQRTETARTTVFDAVLTGRLPHLRWRASRRDLDLVETVIARLDLGAMALRFIDELSGGELQKVAIARALVQEPRLLLLDEPTSSLDLRNQIEILRLLRAVVDERCVAAVVTMHDINTALRFADTLVFVKAGRVLAHVAAADVTAALVSDVYGVEVDLHRVGDLAFVVPMIEKES